MLNLGRMLALLVKVSVKTSPQAIRMRSGVAGVSRTNQPWCPLSSRAAAMASLTAKSATDARKSGGSPTAFDECTALLLGASCKFIVKELFRNKIKFLNKEILGMEMQLPIWVNKILDLPIVQKELDLLPQKTSFSAGVWSGF